MVLTAAHLLGVNEDIGSTLTTWPALHLHVEKFLNLDWHWIAIEKQEIDSRGTDKWTLFVKENFHD